MAKHQRKLIPTTAKEAKKAKASIVTLGKDVPLFEGSGAGQGDWDFLCPHCGRALGESIHEDTVSNVTVVCGRCKKYSRWPDHWPVLS